MGIAAIGTYIAPLCQRRRAPRLWRRHPVTHTSVEHVMAAVNPVQVQKFLKGVDYPASKEQLIENAKKMGADENVATALEKLPEQEYEAPVDVSQALARIH
jgi:hypothetical protein